MVSHLAKNLWWIIFQIVALVYGWSWPTGKIDLFYGYDTLGVLRLAAGQDLQKILYFQIPGTTIGYFKDQEAVAAEVLGSNSRLEGSSDLLIMTNDGQEEDKLLKYLGVDMSRVKFWMNGINKDYSLPAGFDLQAFKTGLGLAGAGKDCTHCEPAAQVKRIDQRHRAMPESSSGNPGPGW